MEPAGLENGQGIVSAAYLRDAADAQWNDDSGIRRFDEFLAKYFPKGNRGAAVGPLRRLTEPATNASWLIALRLAM
ncbi:hypothetical protein [Bradyrhizobium prioriisuperbiae]|uniref:hypothetical protein n=1 Tax=Bradyrhizobium prioriisuperbiae TaxID=2854389 RepID=UPI0028E1D869|nr:hypothetical protein [Bradyrhizobium prioritasuperba]